MKLVLDLFKAKYGMSPQQAAAALVSRAGSHAEALKIARVSAKSGSAGHWARVIAALEGEKPEAPPPVKRTPGAWERGPKGGTRRRLPGGEWEYKGQEAPKLTVTVPKKKRKAKKDPRKIEQVGEHIWGSRKDLARFAHELQAGERTLTGDDLTSMSYDDAAYLVKKSNLVPVHDLDTLKALGMSPGTAHMALAITASISAKAPDSVAGRRQYAEEVTEIVESVKNCKTRRDFDELRAELRQARRGQKEWDLVEAVSGSHEENRKRMAQMEKNNPGSNYRMVHTYGTGQTHIARKAIKKYDALGRRFLTFIGAGKSMSKAYSTANNESFWADDDKFLEKEGFTSGWDMLQRRGVQTAKAKKSKVERQKKISTTERGWSGAKAVAGEIVRIGGTPVKNADERRVKGVFQLKEVDYGTSGYMSQADREYHTKALEGALLDFADIMGVDPKLISLNGRLGIALGARGRGRHAAHYEPSNKVINITKFRGGGSVAHEWGHALDNVMAEVLVGDVEGVAAGVFLSKLRGSDKIPPAVATAMQDVFTAISKSPDPAKARREYSERTIALRNEVTKLTLQQTTLDREASTLKKKPTTQENLDRRLLNRETRLASYKEQLKELKARGGVALRQGQADMEFWIQSTQKEIVVLKQPHALRSEAEQTRIDELTEQSEDLRLIGNRARSKLSVWSGLDPESSNYLRSAQLLGDYWKRTEELFARAFESHIEDAMKAAGRRNTYLVDATTTVYDTKVELPDGSTVQPYPHGVERKAMSKAVARLIDVLKETGTIEKAMKLLTRDSPSTMKLVLDLSKAGPYIGPRGGKWADVKHTVPWSGDKPGKSKARMQQEHGAAVKRYLEQKYDAEVTLVPNGKTVWVSEKAAARIAAELGVRGAMFGDRRKFTVSQLSKKFPKEAKAPEGTGGAFEPTANPSKGTLDRAPDGTAYRVGAVVYEKKGGKWFTSAGKAVTPEGIVQSTVGAGLGARGRGAVAVRRPMKKSVGGTMEGLGRYSQPGWRRPPGIAPVIARDWMDRENRHLLKLYTTMPKPKLLISDGNYRSTMDVMKGLGFSPNEEIAFAARLDRVLNSARNELHVRKAINEMMYVDRFDPSLRAEIARRVLRLYRETRPPDPIRGLVAKSSDIPLVVIL